NRTGPWGTLASVVAGFKVLAKEDYTPTGADSAVFTVAPIITFLASILTLLVIPFAPGLVGIDMNIGLLYFFAVSGLSVVGLMMGGWSSPIDPRPILDFFHVWIASSFNVASLDNWLLWLVVIIVPLFVLGLTLLLWTLKSSWGFLKSLVIAFVLFNVFVLTAVLFW